MQPPLRKHSRLELHDLTKDSVSAFLLPGDQSEASKGVDSTSKATVKKDVLRAAMLKYHPDKFEARVLLRVHEDDKERVREAGGAVMRILNELSEIHP